MFSNFVALVLDLFGKIPYFAQYLIIPLILIFLLWKVKNKSKLDWLIKTLVLFSFMLVLLYGAASDISIGYYTYFILFLLSISTAIFSFFKVKDQEFYHRKKFLGWVGYTMGILIILVCLYLNINAFKACFYNEKSIELTFPFKSGVFLINQGGDGEKSSIMNYHYLDAANKAWRYNVSMRYANDIVKLNNFGFSINSFSLNNKLLIPTDLNKYEIFGETIYSPCDGVVYYIENGYKDMPAIPTKYYGDTGNGIVIKCNDIYVMMWHLKQGSITVNIGDNVKIGQPIGQVGNSGHSSTPHLHIQASKDNWEYGKSVPIVFDGRFPVRHSLFIR